MADDEAPFLHPLKLQGTGATLMFEDVSFSVDVAEGRKVILDGISGIVEPGQCCAILGSSGSGKTSLLDILAAHNVHPRVKGSIYLNDRAATPSLIRATTGYVMQDDRLLPNLTVRETFQYAARLRLSATMTTGQKMAQVEATIDALGLRNVANNKIGGTFRRGISGGEKRRVSIGLQLLGEPSVLFLDEPTTGLDSFTANSIVQMLRALAEGGKTIIFTIHQPRSDIFELLDVMMLLSQGQCVYFGEAAQVISHFTALGHPCEQYSNPLDHYIDVVSVDKRSIALFDETSNRLADLIDGFHESEAHRSLKQRIAAFHAAPPTEPISMRTMPGALTVQRTLLERMLRNLLRDPSAIFDRTMQLTFFGLLLFIFIISFGFDQVSVQNRSGFLFETVSVAMMLGMMNGIALFPEHRDLYFRERRDKSYNAISLVIAYLLHCLPTAITTVSLFFFITYFPLGMQAGPVQYATFWGVVLLLHLWGELCAIFMLGVFFDVHLANSNAALFISATTMLASGFLRSTDTLPEVLNILSYTSISKFSAELLVVNEFTDLRFNCSLDAEVPCRFPTGNYYIEKIYPGADERGPFNWGMMAVHMALFFILAVAILHIGVRTLR